MLQILADFLSALPSPSELKLPLAHAKIAKALGEDCQPNRLVKLMADALTFYPVPCGHQNVYGLEASSALERWIDP